MVKLGVVLADRPTSTMGGCGDPSNSSFDNIELDLNPSKLEPRLLLYNVGSLSAALCV